MFNDSVEGDILEEIAVALRNRYGSFGMVDFQTMGQENLYGFKVADRFFTISFPVDGNLYEEGMSAFDEVGVPWKFNVAGHLERSI